MSDEKTIPWDWISKTVIPVLLAALIAGVVFYLKEWGALVRRVERIDTTLQLLHSVPKAEEGK